MNRISIIILIFSYLIMEANVRQILKTRNRNVLFGDEGRMSASEIACCLNNDPAFNSIVHHYVTPTRVRELLKKASRTDRRFACFRSFHPTRYLFSVYL